MTRELFIPLLLLVAMASAMAYQARTLDPVLTAAKVVHLGEIDGYASEAREVSEAELTTLPKDTMIEKRFYSDGGGKWFHVSIVTGGHSKSSLHQPEICLPSQGYQMREPHTIAVAGRTWRVLTLARGEQPPIGFAYTFFNQNGFCTSSHLRRIAKDVWDRCILNRIDRWVMVNVNASCTDGDEFRRILELVEGGLR